MSKTGRNDDVYLIIPVYNEQATIAAVISEASNYFANIVCINDGSTDQSSTIIKKTKAILVEHCLNLGQGAGLQTGVEYALQDPTARFFVTFDADGQHDIHDALTMVEYIRANHVDIVLGSRFLGSSENMSMLRKMTLKAAIIFSNVTTDLKLTDTHNGLRVFNRKFASSLKMTMPGMAYASELIHIIARGGFRYVELPNTITYSSYSKSKGQSSLNAVNISVDLLLNRPAEK